MRLRKNELHIFLYLLIFSSLTKPAPSVVFPSLYYVFFTQQHFFFGFGFLLSKLFDEELFHFSLNFPRDFFYLQIVFLSTGDKRNEAKLFLPEINSHFTQIFLLASAFFPGERSLLKICMIFNLRRPHKTGLSRISKDEEDEAKKPYKIWIIYTKLTSREHLVFSSVSI